MIYTFLADISRLNSEAALKYQNELKSSDGCFENIIKKIPSGKSEAPKLGEEIISHILSGKDPALQRERCGAYLLLSSVMTEMFGCMLPLNRQPNGKPYFDRSSGVKVSISHSSDVVAVAISCDGCVGVDIEREINTARAERLEKRFFSELTFCERETDVTYIYCALDEKGRCEFYPFVKERECHTAKKDTGEIFLYNSTFTDCFSAKWTLYEAALKCDGGGFTSLPCLEMILLETRAETKRICINGNTYYITSAASI